MSLTIGYAGMTHLGLCSGIGATEKGFEVIGYDPDPRLVARLDAGTLPISEPSLDELLARNAERIRFTSKASELSACDLVYVAPDVPTDDAGRCDESGVEALLERVREAVPSEVPVVVLSQVRPGFTRARARARGDGILYYQVETLIFGRAVERVLEPERFIVGCDDPARPLAPVYRAFLEAFGCPILPMRYESAELAKISINVLLVAQVSAANTLANLCERIGADWSEIAPALRLDRRIGAHAYIAPGLGLSGGNLERDLAAVMALARQVGSDARVVEAFVANSAYRRDWVLRRLHQEVFAHVERPTVAILGLAYKADTASTKNSPALALIAALGATPLRLYDPLVDASTLDLPASATRHESALEACRGAHAIVVMTPWTEFGALDPEAVTAAASGRPARTPIVVDPYRALDAYRIGAAGLRYLTLGAPENEEEDIACSSI